jgi:hypothetical protein
MAPSAIRARTRVIERAQVGGELVLGVAGQEADGFAGLDRRPRQHDAADGARFQGLHRLGDGQVGLAGSGGAQRHDQVLGVDGVDQGLLAGGFRLDGLEVALLAVVVGVVMGQRGPAPVEWEPADLIVALELAGVERAFAQLSLQGSLAHTRPPLAPLGGQRKRASRVASALRVN